MKLLIRENEDKYELLHRCPTLAPAIATIVDRLTGLCQRRRIDFPSLVAGPTTVHHERDLQIPFTGPSR
jgi:hypothetical protein